MMTSGERISAGVKAIIRELGFTLDKECIWHKEGISLIEASRPRPPRRLEICLHPGLFHQRGRVKPAPDLPQQLGLPVCQRPAAEGGSSISGAVRLLFSLALFASTAASCLSASSLLSCSPRILPSSACTIHLSPSWVMYRFSSSPSSSGSSSSWAIALARWTRPSAASAAAQEGQHGCASGIVEAFGVARHGDAGILGQPGRSIHHVAIDQLRAAADLILRRRGIVAAGRGDHADGKCFQVPVPVHLEQPFGELV